MSYGGIGGPPNAFNNILTYPTPEMRVVVRPNFDTLYSSAWLDLTKEPVVISVPDTHGRYYLLPMLDMWTDVFASPGWRTTGTAAGNFLIVPEGWRPDLRDRFAQEFKLPADTQRIDAPTPYVWVIGRFKTEVIRRLGPWRSVEAVELATLTWIDWFNHRRLLEPIGFVPPAEAEAAFYNQLAGTSMAA